MKKVLVKGFLYASLILILAVNLSAQTGWAYFKPDFIPANSYNSIVTEPSTSGCLTCASHCDAFSDNTCSATTHYNGAQTINIQQKDCFVDDGSCNGTCQYDHTVYQLVDGTNNIITQDFTSGDIISTSNSSSTCDPGDDKAVSAHWGVEATEAFYKAAPFSWNSYDGTGAGITNKVNWIDNSSGSPVNVDNAAWQGSGVINYGYGVDFNPLVALDVTGHEFTHGVSDAIIGSGGLDYTIAECGALAESISDMFAITMAQNTISGWGWVIGKDVISGGLRDMSNPPSSLTPGPDTYLGTNWISSPTPCPDESDDCAAHRDALVGDFWFFLLAHGGSGTNDNGYSFCVDGIGTASAIKIVWNVLNNDLTTSSSYADFAAAAITEADALFPKNNSGGATSNEVIQVVNAFAAVGIFDNSTNDPFLPFNQPITLQGRNAVNNEDDENIGTITAKNFNVTAGTTCAFISGSNIYLESGFNANVNSNFLAKCDVTNITCESHSRISNPTGGNNISGWTTNQQPTSQVTTTSIATTTQKTSKVKVYPNPSNGNITIEKATEDESQVNVSDLSGNIIYNSIINGAGANTINLSTVENGAYFLQIQTGAISQKFKIMIIK